MFYFSLASFPGLLQREERAWYNIIHVQLFVNMMSCCSTCCPWASLDWVLEQDDGTIVASISFQIEEIVSVSSTITRQYNSCAKEERSYITQTDYGCILIFRNIMYMRKHCIPGTFLSLSNRPGNEANLSHDLCVMWFVYNVCMHVIITWFVHKWSTFACDYHMTCTYRWTIQYIQWRIGRCCGEHTKFFSYPCLPRNIIISICYV